MVGEPAIRRELRRQHQQRRAAPAAQQVRAHAGHGELLAAMRHGLTVIGFNGSRVQGSRGGGRRLPRGRGCGTRSRKRAHGAFKRRRVVEHDVMVCVGDLDALGAVGAAASSAANLSCDSSVLCAPRTRRIGTAEPLQRGQPIVRLGVGDSEARSNSQRPAPVGQLPHGVCRDVASSAGIGAGLRRQQAEAAIAVS